MPLRATAMSTLTPPAFEPRSLLPLPALRRRLGLLQWLLPAGLLLMVVLYELGPSRWVQARWGDGPHLVADALVYGTIGPVLAFGLLRFVRRWLEARETAERQAQALAQAREHARITHDLTDDVLQSLFGLSVVLDTLQASLPADLPPESQRQFAAAQGAVRHTLDQLYTNTTHLRRG
jgi:signal transduction histidine kinase